MYKESESESEQIRNAFPDRRGGVIATLFACAAAHSQMWLPAPSSTDPGIPLNHTEFRGIDTTGDGFENTVHGFAYYDEDDPQLGEVRVLSTFNPNDDIVIYGEQLNDSFGFRVVGIPDVSFNGNHDLVISTPLWQDVAGAIVGKVYVVRGSDGAILHTMQGSEPEGFFGYAVASVGDITGDGISDIAVGAPHGGPNREGRSNLYSGLTGALIDQIDGTVTSGYFGASISGAGDLTGDGFADFVVGSPGGDRRQFGQAYVFAGQTRSLLCMIEGTSQNGRFGTAVAGGEDVTGNGLPDVLISAPGAANADPSTIPPQDPYSYGRVHLFSAGTILSSGGSLLANTADLMILPTHDGDTDFGTKVEVGNDMTLDGLPNIIIGSVFETDNEELLPPWSDSNENARVNIISGVDGSITKTYVVGENVEATIGYYEPISNHCHPNNPYLCMLTCEQVYAHCPNPQQLCTCLNNAITTYNTNARDFNRHRWWGVPICGGVCLVSPLFLGPIGVGGLCGGCIVAWNTYTLSQRFSIRTDLVMDWGQCFANNGGIGCLNPGFPFW